MNGMLKELPLEDVRPTRYNTRKVAANDPHIQELAESIGQMGLLQPVVCRPCDDGYELLSGRRRWEAHHLLKRKTILAVVSDITDDEAMDVVVAENLQRRDLTPLEESRAVAMLIDHGRDLQDVAARMGKSQAWIRRRAKLAGLTPSWQAALEGDEEEYQLLRDNVSVAVLELVAHLSPELQNEMLIQINESWRIDEMRHAREFTDLLGAHTRALKDAPWGQSEKVYAAGQRKPLPLCSTCQFRSDHEPDLFADVIPVGGDEKDAACMDQKCFALKWAAWLDARKLEAEKEAGGPVATFSTDWTPAFIPEPSMDRGTVVPAGTKGAVPAIEVYGADAGKLVWVKAPSNEGEQDAPNEPEKSLRELRVRHMSAAFREWCDAQKECPKALRVSTRLLAVLAWTQGMQASTPKEFDDFDLPEVVDYVWNGIKADLPGYLHPYMLTEDGQESAEKHMRLTMHRRGSHITTSKMPRALRILIRTRNRPRRRAGRSSQFPPMSGGTARQSFVVGGRRADVSTREDENMDALETAVEALAEAKRKEDAAKKARVAAEDAVCEFLGGTCPEEGSKSHLVAEYKVTIKRSFRYSADLDGMRGTNVSGLTLPIKIKEELDEKGYRWLRENDPDTFAKISPFVTRTPAKTAVSVERKEKL